MTPRPSQEAIDAAARAILNARGARRGAPAISNIDKLVGPKTWADAQEDAEAALSAELQGDALKKVEERKAREARICTGYTAGQSIRQLGERFGMSYDVVRRVLLSHKVKIRTRGAAVESGSFASP